MISSALRSVAADANVLLGACLGAATRRVFIESALEVVTTLYNVDEVQEYLPKIALRRHLNLETLQTSFRLLRLGVVPESSYAAALRRAQDLVPDPVDIHLAALALTRRILVWSNDGDFDGFPTGVYTTAQLLKHLGL